MARICLNCGGVIQQRVCAGCRQRCGVRSPSAASGTSAELEESRWQHTPLGRIVVGLLLAQGLAHGLRMFFNAGLQAAGEPGSHSWDPLVGVLLMQALHGVCLLLAGALAGAGQHSGALIGSVVGLFNGLILLTVQRAAGEPLTEMLLYGQPLFHLGCGLLGGLIGSIIWKPLPRITLAPALEKRPGRATGISPPLFAGPIAWGRVLVGSAIVIPGVVWANVVLNFFLDLGQGQFLIQTHSDVRFLTVEIGVLAILLGAGVAGTNTFNGAKQGLIVGLFAGVIIAGLQLGGNRLPFNLVVGTATSVVILSIVGAWFGCKVLPPVVSASYRRLSEA